MYVHTLHSPPQIHREGGKDKTVKQLESIPRPLALDLCAHKTSRQFAVGETLVHTLLSEQLGPQSLPSSLQRKMRHSHTPQMQLLTVALQFASQQLTAYPYSSLYPPLILLPACTFCSLCTQHFPSHWILTLCTNFLVWFSSHTAGVEQNQYNIMIAKHLDGTKNARKIGSFLSVPRSCKMVREDTGTVFVLTPFLLADSAHFEACCCLGFASFYKS